VNHLESNEDSKNLIKSRLEHSVQKILSQNPDGPYSSVEVEIFQLLANISGKNVKIDGE